MRKNEAKEMHCPFCEGSGDYKFSEIRSERQYEKEVIARFLKSTGMDIKNIQKWMGYKSSRSVKLLLNAGISITNE
jgi:hypothetical protein